MSGSPQKESEGDDKSAEDEDQHPRPKIPTHSEIEAELERRKAKMIQDRKQREEIAAANAKLEKDLAAPMPGWSGMAAPQWGTSQNAGNCMGVNWGAETGFWGFTEYGPTWFPGMAFPQPFGGMFNAIPSQQTIPFMAPSIPQAPLVVPQIRPPTRPSIPSQPSPFRPTLTRSTQPTIPPRISLSPQNPATSAPPPIQPDFPPRPLPSRQTPLAPVAPPTPPIGPPRVSPSQRTPTAPVTPPIQLIPLPKPSPSDPTPTALVVSPKKTSAPSSRNICGNCGARGHGLVRCTIPDDDGYLRGCPVCNIKAHSLADCPSMKICAHTLWLYLRANRDGECPLEFHVDWRSFQNPNNLKHDWKVGRPNRAWYSKQCKENPGCFQRYDPHWTLERMKLTIGSEITPNARVSAERKAEWDAVVRSLPPFSRHYFPEKAAASADKASTASAKGPSPNLPSDFAKSSSANQAKVTQTPSIPRPKVVKGANKQNEPALGPKTPMPQQDKPRPGSAPLERQGRALIDRSKGQSDPVLGHPLNLEEFINERRKRPRRSSSAEAVAVGETSDRRTKRKVSPSSDSANKTRDRRGGEDIQRSGSQLSRSAASTGYVTSEMESRHAPNASRRQTPAEGCRRCLDRGCHHCEDQ